MGKFSEICINLLAMASKLPSHPLWKFPIMSKFLWKLENAYYVSLGLSYEIKKLKLWNLKLFEINEVNL